MPDTRLDAIHKDQQAIGWHDSDAMTCAQAKQDRARLLDNAAFLLAHIDALTAAVEALPAYRYADYIDRAAVLAILGEPE
jgi:hypothetical protein